MGRGYSDWGINPAGAGQIGTDLYEIPARLGGMVSVVRTGQVIITNPFIEWARRGYGVSDLNATIELSARTAVVGGTSLYIAPKTSGLRMCGYYDNLPPIDTRRLGLEYYVAIEDDPAKQPCYHYGRVGIWSGGYRLEFNWMVNPSNDTVGINGVYIDPSTFTVIHTVTEGWSSGLYGYIWHNLKFVFDLYNRKWRRLYVDGVGYDISNYTPYSTVAGSKQSTVVSLLVSQSDDLQGIYLDNLIVTYDEP